MPRLTRAVPVTAGRRPVGALASAEPVVSGVGTVEPHWPGRRARRSAAVGGRSYGAGLAPSTRPRCRPVAQPHRTTTGRGRLAQQPRRQAVVDLEHLRQVRAGRPAAPSAPPACAAPAGPGRRRRCGTAGPAATRSQACAEHVERVRGRRPRSRSRSTCAGSSRAACSARVSSFSASSRLGCRPMRPSSVGRWPSPAASASAAASASSSPVAGSSSWRGLDGRGGPPDQLGVQGGPRRLHPVVQPVQPGRRERQVPAEQQQHAAAATASQHVSTAHVVPEPSRRPRVTP